MSFRLKAATLAALALSSIAAIQASDASFANAAPDEASISTLPTSSSVAETVEPAKAGAPVKYAPRAEIVQALSAQPVASLPIVEPSIEMSAPTLAALVDMQGTPEALDEQMQCLAGAVYFESKGESLAGQLAVARVIINRMKSGRFADSLCGVVYQRGQFSFVRGRNMPAIPLASSAWREAVAIAQIATSNAWKSVAEGALYFHARRVSPGWGRARVALIDNHVFYR